MKYIVPICLLLTMISCGDDDKSANPEPAGPIDYTVQNEEDIKMYLQENNLEAQRSDTGLYYIIEEPGTGARPSATSDVTVAYKGYFLNGEVFDQSDSEGITFNLQQVIKGWTEGITYFKEGGSGMLLVPARLGYGSSQNRSIPCGSVLLFDIDLIAVD